MARGMRPGVADRREDDPPLSLGAVRHHFAERMAGSDFDGFSPAFRLLLALGCMAVLLAALYLVWDADGLRVLDAGSRVLPFPVWAVLVVGTDPFLWLALPLPMVRAAWRPRVLVAVSAANLLALAGFVVAYAGLPAESVYFLLALGFLDLATGAPPVNRALPLILLTVAFRGRWDVPVLLLAVLVVCVLLHEFRHTYGEQLRRSRLRQLQQEVMDARGRARMDPLTRLFTRSILDEEVAALFEYCHARGLPFGVVLLDLDRFKQVNDGFGHQAGDDLLQDVARQLMRGCRKEDFVVRYGGDEFLLLTAAIKDYTHLRAMAERYRGLLGSVALPGGGHLTVSLGACLSPATPVASLAEAIALADRALYAAKDAGRDRLVLFPELPPEA